MFQSTCFSIHRHNNSISDYTSRVMRRNFCENTPRRRHLFRISFRQFLKRNNCPNNNQIHSFSTRFESRWKTRRYKFWNSRRIRTSSRSVDKQIYTFEYIHFREENDPTSDQDVLSISIGESLKFWTRGGDKRGEVSIGKLTRSWMIFAQAEIKQDEWNSRAE